MFEFIKLNSYNFISTMLTIVSLIVAVYYGKKSIRLENKIKRFDWYDVERGIKKISCNKGYKKFKPNAIISISGPGSIISSLFLTHTEQYLPIFLCISERTNEKVNLFKSEHYDSFNTANWTTHVPKDIELFKNKKIVIIDDTVNTGETMETLYQLINKYGFAKNNILRVSLFVTKLALKSKRAPDLYFYEINESEFQLPWGENSLGTY